MPRQRWDSDFTERVWLVPARVGWAAWPWLIALAVFADMADLPGLAKLLSVAGVAAIILAMTAGMHALWTFRRHYGSTLARSSPHFRPPRERVLASWLFGFPGERPFRGEWVVFAALLTGQAAFFVAAGLSLLDDGT